LAGHQRAQPLAEQLVIIDDPQAQHVVEVATARSLRKYGQHWIPADRRIEY
jgi:hypothetical protein